MRWVLLVVAARPAALSVAPAPAPRILLYVDPCAERTPVLTSCEERGVDVVLLHSEPAAAVILAGAADKDTAERVHANTAPAAGAEASWLAEQAFPADTVIEGVLCGSDGGLACAERLAHALAPARSNGVLPARRDKYLMNVALREAGLPATEQLSPASWEEARAFLAPRLPVVLKPRRGQASVLVGLARTEAQARGMYEALRASASSVSIDRSEAKPGDELVVQERLLGDEWVVDTVSRDGEHKALALWKYDKGEANGAPFVYFGDELMPLAGEAERRLVAAAFAALDALGWRWGPAHIEMKLTPERGPMVVEANAGRWNGVDFQMLAQVCVGYDALEATLDAYLDDDAWRAVPTLPPSELRGAARLVKLVSSVEGTLLGLNHAELASLPSVLRLEPEPSEPGERVVRTVDLATAAGYAYLLHADPAVVEADYQTLRARQPTLFEVQGQGALDP